MMLIGVASEMKLHVNGVVMLSSEYSGSGNVAMFWCMCPCIHMYMAQYYG